MEQFETPTTKPPQDPLLISYWTLRKAIGIIGIALPIILAVGSFVIAGGGIQSSISGYYYTVMRGVLVGSLWSIAIFLFAYRGYEKQDNIAGKIASAAAIGVALFPTTPDFDATPLESYIGKAHLTFAVIFFVILAYFSLILFRKTDPSIPPTAKKLLRNKIYTSCGYIILACIIGIGLFKGFLADSAPKT